MEKDPTEGSTWLEQQKEQIKQDVTDFRLADCKECRYIGGTVMIVTGGYVGYVGHRRVVMRGGGVFSRVPSALVAGLMFSLGILRLAGVNPFTNSEAEVGIDFLRKLRKPKESEDSAG